MINAGDADTRTRSHTPRASVDPQPGGSGRFPESVDPVSLASAFTTRRRPGGIDDQLRQVNNLPLASLADGAEIGLRREGIVRDTLGDGGEPAHRRPRGRDGKALFSAPREGERPRVLEVVHRRPASGGRIR